jgi:pentalenene oxygenase
LPFIGHALPLFRAPLMFLQSLPSVGDLVRVDIGTVPMYVVTTPELTRQVLVDCRTFDKGGHFYDKVRQAIGDGLLTSPYAPHRRQRRLVQPAFLRERIIGYSRTMGAMITDVLAAWQDGAVVDVAQSMHDLTTRTAARCMFAADIADSVAEEVREYIDAQAEGLYLRMVAPVAAFARIPTPGNLRYGRAVRRLHGIVDEMISTYPTATCCRCC